MIDIDLQRKRVYVDDLETGSRYLEGPPSVEQVLGDLALGDNGTLEGLAVHLPEDPTKDCGFKHLGLLTTALAELSNLTQLVVNTVHYPRTQLTGNMMIKAARKLAAAAPRLRYIKVHWRCWRIWRRGVDTVELEELEGREIGDVELFAQTVWEM